jgi:hypothetical protein
VILNFCVACGDEDPLNLEHHHLVPRTAGGSDDPKNLITLCHSCHGKMHGYERVNLRKLTMIGQAAAKAKGRLFGNPHMRSRDPEALLRISEEKRELFLKRIKESSKVWLPIVQQMRPSATWIDVLHAVNEVMDEKWTVSRLRRAVGELVDLGQADPSLLNPAPRSEQSPDAVVAIREMLQADPSISVRQIASQLNSMGILTKRGSAKWGEGSVHKILKRAKASLEEAER